MKLKNIYVIASLIFFLSGFAILSNKVFAQSTTKDIDGYIWSDNIGWISMSNKGNSAIPYQVTKNSSGALIGWAWSDSVGWVRFDPAFVGPTSYTGTEKYGVKVTGSGPYQIKGWARACAGTLDGKCGTTADHPDGWDGWIRFGNDSFLTNSGVQVVDGANTKIKYRGYSWGDMVQGWVNIGDTQNGITWGMEELLTIVGAYNYSTELTPTFIATTDYTYTDSSDGLGIITRTVADGEKVSYKLKYKLNVDTAAGDQTSNYTCTLKKDNTGSDLITGDSYDDTIIFDDVLLYKSPFTNSYTYTCDRTIGGSGNGNPRIVTVTVRTSSIPPINGGSHTSTSTGPIRER